MDDCDCSLLVSLNVSFLGNEIKVKKSNSIRKFVSHLSTTGVKKDFGFNAMTWDAPKYIIVFLFDVDWLIHLAWASNRLGELELN